MARFAAGIIVVVLLCVTFAPAFEMGAGVDYWNRRNSIAVVRTGDDSSIETAIDWMNLSEYVHPVVMLTATNEAQLRLIVETSICFATIYVGHGTPEGLSIGSHLTSWLELARWTNKSSNTYHIFGICYSAKAVTNTSRAFGFPNQVDARIVGLVCQAFISRFDGAAERAANLVKRLFSEEMIELWVKPSLPLWAYGPWATNPALNTVITGLIYIAITLGLAWLIPEIVAAIAVYFAYSWIWWLLGFALFTDICAALIALAISVVCYFEWWIRSGYEPGVGWHDQAQFRVINLILMQYIWYSPYLYGIH
jgi:hypothetical protein